MKNIALLGNPNTGKTSLFNALTGSYEYVGNWSGVTVEKKIGELKRDIGFLIDLPGVYDLNPISRDEAVVTNFLLEGEGSYDSIINIVDASQLERNLQLTVELLEVGVPTTIGLNMLDISRKKGIQVDTEKLAELLSTKVVPIIARKEQGCDELLSVMETTKGTSVSPLRLPYDKKFKKVIEGIEGYFQQYHHKNSYWMAVQFLTYNESVENFMKKESCFGEMIATRSALEAEMGQSLEQYVYEIRERYITSILKEVVVYVSEGTLLTESVDKILTHKVFGLPIFLVIMFIVFQGTFAWIGSPLSDMLDGFFSGPLTDWVIKGLEFLGAAPFVQDLVTEGIIAGVGGILVFVPQIFILFFFISLLEDSGYMSRIAVIMDRVMEFFGLNGKAFIPMIIGFGCNVPGIMAARTVEQPKERLVTILVSPFMSCSARLPIYAVFTGVFFANHQGAIVLSLYVLGVLLALITAKVLTMTIMKEETSVFIIELPPYRVPHLKTLWRSTWEKGKGFIRKAGTFIFAGSVFIWLLAYMGPSGLDVAIDESFLAVIGGVVGTLLIPLGFGTWQAGAALIAGFAAKEVVVSTLAIIYSASEGHMSQIIKAQYTPLTAFAFMVFVLLYVPCLATVGAIRREVNSLKWTWFAVGYPLIVSYVLVLLIYQIGSLLGF